MPNINEFFSLFAPASMQEAERQRLAQEEQLRTAQQLNELVIGQPASQDPGGLFVDNPIAGGDPLAGFAGTPGVLPEGQQRDFISTLLQSGSPQFANQGIGLAQQQLEALALQQQTARKEDIAGRAREALNRSRQKAVSRLQAGTKLSPGTQFQADIFAGGGPSSAEAFKGLNTQLAPFSLSPGQTRFGGLGNQIAVGGVDPGKKTAAETGLRKEFGQVAKAFTVSDDSMSKIKALGTVSTPTPATDNSLLFQYARLLSPGIVTSDDFENAKKSGTEGWAGQIQALASQMVNGKLPVSVRANIIQAAAVQFQGEVDVFNARKKDYTDLAISNDLDPHKVTGLRKVRTDVTNLLSPPPPPGFRRP